MTGTDIVQYNTEEELIAAQMAANGGDKEYKGFPRLLINKSAEDSEDTIIMKADGKPLGAGSFNVAGTDVYAKTATIRIIRHEYKYLRYSEDGDFKVVSRTKYFKNFFDNLLDTSGTVRCGRPMGKAFKALPEEKQKYWRSYAPCFVHAFGLVEMEGLDEPVLVDFRLGGGKMAAFLKLFNSYRDEKKEAEFYKTEFELTLTKEKNGQNVFFDVHFTPSTGDNNIPFASVAESFGLIQQHIDEENSDVLERHQQAVAERNGDTHAEEALEGVVDVEVVDVTPDDVDVELKPKEKKAGKAKAKKVDATPEAEGDLDDEIPF